MAASTLLGPCLAMICAASLTANERFVGSYEDADRLAVDLYADGTFHHEKYGEPTTGTWVARNQLLIIANTPEREPSRRCHDAELPGRAVRVTDTDDTSLPGVTVRVSCESGEEHRVVTDDSGRASLPGCAIHELEASLMAFRTATFTSAALGECNTIELELDIDITVKDELWHVTEGELCNLMFPLVRSE